VVGEWWEREFKHQDTRITKGRRCGTSNIQHRTPNVQRGKGSTIRSRVNILILLLAVMGGCSRQGEETMPARTDAVSGGVSKIVVTVEKEGVSHHLFSRKNAPGQKKNDRLEFLGGHIENETPAAAAARELAEEEKTGSLAAKLAGKQAARQVNVDGQPHHIFKLSISYEEYLCLIPDPRESLGFAHFPIRSHQLQPVTKGHDLTAFFIGDHVHIGMERLFMLSNKLACPMSVDVQLY